MPYLTETTKMMLKTALALTNLIEVLTLLGVPTTVDGTNIYKTPAILGKDVLIVAAGTPSTFAIVLSALYCAKIAAEQYNQDHTVRSAAAATLVIAGILATAVVPAAQGKYTLDYFSPGYTDGTPSLGLLAADLAVGTAIISAVCLVINYFRPYCSQPPSTTSEGLLPSFNSSTAKASSCVDYLYSACCCSVTSPQPGSNEVV